MTDETNAYDPLRLLEMPGGHPADVVDDVDLAPYLGHDPLRTTPASEGTPQLHRAPLLALRDLVTDPRFIPLFGRALVTTDPRFRTLLPRDPAPVLEQFVRAIAYVFVTVEEAAGDQSLVDPVVDFARHLGEDHAKLGLTEEHFSSFGSVLADTLRHLAGSAWSDRLGITLDTAYSVVTASMIQGIASVPGPARVGATVVEATRPTRDVAVVRLVTDEMIHYHPGQYLSVQTPYTPTEWRRFSPSIPTNPARQIEFHIRAVDGGDTSGALLRGVDPGDRWVLARPLGHLDVDRTDGRDILMIAGGTGIAPLRALLVDGLRFADHPRVHLFYGARYPSELYALPMLVDVAASAPWLTVQPVSEEDEDPWWLRDSAAPVPRAMHRIDTGRLVEVVTGYGSWADRQVLVAGSPEMIRGTVRGLVAAGTPRGSILYDPF